MKIHCWMLSLIIPTLTFAAKRDFKGQLSLQGIAWNRAGSWYNSDRIQYIPNLQISSSLSLDRLVDFEGSFYLYISHEDGEISDDLRPYRLNLRYATRQSETQVGLQKINFGPAQLLRSLMWFDRQNPTDPLNFTEGVWGLRYRYNWLNNANIWLWGLLCKEPKGYETIGSDKPMPEYGGRIQVPVPAGELALTVHRREIFENAYDMETYFPSHTYFDNRIALDGRWDIIVGAWFETVVQNVHDSGFDYFTKMSTLGMDYTFGIGNGLYVLAEHMIVQTAKEILSSNREYQYSAIMLNYPLGIFDNLSLMGFYSWDTDDFIQYVSWQRSYDKIMINLALFHFPETRLLTVNTTGGDLGIRLMLIFNH